MINEKLNLSKSIQNVAREISNILSDCTPSIYLYGSLVLNDFQLGWSDIDLLVLTKKSISQNQAEMLLMLRQNLHGNEPDNSYYRCFEGAILSLSAFTEKMPDIIVYWGSRGESITDSYMFNSLSLLTLLEHGIILCGDDVRQNFKKPDFTQLLSDIEEHYYSIR